MVDVHDFQSMMLPLLQHMEDGKVRTSKEIIAELSEAWHLADDQRHLKHEKSGHNILQNNINWSEVYLVKSGLLIRPQRGHFVISEKGKSLLQEKLKRIDIKFLKQRSCEFNAWLSQRARSSHPAVETTTPLSETNGDVLVSRPPDEILDETYSLLCNDLAEDLLEQIRGASWQFFERLVVDVITKMGYGGSRQDAGKVVGRSGDNGIDGLINEDKLGLDVLYIQAKKYDGPIPISQVRDFAGALLAKKARKGIFITTSTFPKTAVEFVSQIEPRIILIDGERLAQLMIEHNVGVSIKETYEIKRIDNDYFEENDI